MISAHCHHILDILVLCLPCNVVRFHLEIKYYLGTNMMTKNFPHCWEIFLHFFISLLCVEYSAIVIMPEITLERHSLKPVLKHLLMSGCTVVK